MGFFDAAFRPPDTTERRTDWVFVAFVAFAVAMSAHTVVQRTRLRNAVRLATACLAQADTGCARDAIAAARALDAADLRVRVAAADLGVLAGETDRAEAEVAALVAEAAPRSLPSSIRANLLLVQGDVASARGAVPAATEHYEAALQLLPTDTLVRPRLDRLAEQERQRRVWRAGLFGDLDLLLRAAEEGDADTFAARAKELAPRIAKVGNKDAREKITAALAAAERVATRPRDAPSAETDPLGAYRPVPPVRSNVRSAAAEAVYQAQLVAYAQAVGEWEKKRTDAERTRRELGASAPDAATQGLEEARTQVADAKAILEGPAVPAR